MYGYAECVSAYNIGEFAGSSINPKSAIKYKLKGITRYVIDAVMGETK